MKAGKKSVQKYRIALAWESKICPELAVLAQLCFSGHSGEPLDATTFLHIIIREYLTLSTDATPSAIAQDTVFARNHLVLAASADLYHWDTCYVVLMDDTGT